MAGKAAYRKRRQNRLAMLLVTTVVLMMMLVVTVKSVELREKRAVCQEREAALLREIELEQSRSAEIEEYGKYTQTKKFVEEVAKEKLGLVYDGEIIFKDEK